MRLKRILIIGTIFPVLFSIVLFFGILISGEDDDSSNSYSPVYSGMNLSADVLKHQPMVEKYARESGITEYVNVLLAIIQVESGGTATDVMQSSESLGLPPNSLSTEESIKQGCKYFASLLSSCKAKGMNDINVVIQSYNYGGGYADYVTKNGKKHSFNLAENFAFFKDKPASVAACNSDIGFFCLSRSVYNTSHNRNFNIKRNVCYHLFYLVCKLDQINSCSSTSRTGYNFNTSLAKSKCLKNQFCCTDLFYRISCQGNTDCITDSLMENDSKSYRRFHIS